MFDKTIHNKIHYYFSLLIAFSLPIGKFSPPLIVLLFLNYVLEGNFKEKYVKFISNKPAILFFAFYFLHLIGMIYSKNINSGMFDLQVKLSLLIFPLMFTAFEFDSKQLKWILNLFVVGCVTACLVMLLKSGYKFLFISHNFRDFFYLNYSTLLHPSYMSMYICFSICILTINFFNCIDTSEKILIVAAIIFFSVNIILLSSKAGIILLIAIIIYIFTHVIFIKRKFIIGIILFVVIGISSIYILKKTPVFIARLKEVSTEIKTGASSDYSQHTSTGVRILIWKACYEVIKHNPILGVGTGDGKDILLKEYEKRGLTAAVEKKLNAHNQYLETTIKIGFIGLFFLLATLLIPLCISIKQRDFLYACFLLIIIFNFVPETMLATQAGTMFYGFFNSLLCFRKK